MVVIDRNFVRAFSPDEQLVMLRILLEADENGELVYDAKKMRKWTRLSDELLSGIYRKLTADDVIIEKEGKVAVNDFDGYQYSGKKKAKKREVVTGEPLEARAKKFYDSLIPYVDSFGGKYPKEMIRSFYNYWSEPNHSRTKMKWELQKTWSVAGRLATWAKNDKNFNNTSRYGQRTDDVQRRQEGAAAIIARLAAEENSDNQ